MTASQDDIGFALPLFVAIALTLVTITIHALAFITTIHYVLYGFRLITSGWRFLATNGSRLGF